MVGETNIISKTDEISNEDKKTTIYCCSYCGEEFRALSALRRHLLLTDHGEMY